jgi:hypothetical protein
MPRKIIIALVVLLVLTFGLGTFFGMMLKSKTTNKDSSYQVGWDAAKEQLQKTGLSVPEGMEIKTLSGTVEKVTGNTLILKNVISSDPLGDPSLSSRTVQIASDTKLYRLSQKDSDQFKRETEEFDKKIKEQPESVGSVTPPNPQNKDSISISDIKEGQFILVTSKDNIKDKKEFVASEVSVQSLPVVPEIKNPQGNTVSTPPAPAGISTSAPTSPISSPPSVPKTSSPDSPAPPAPPIK